MAIVVMAGKIKHNLIRIWTHVRGTTHIFEKETA